MAVYYIGSYDIDNMEVFQDYPPKVLQILKKYNAEVLASDVEAITLEGKAKTMNAIVKFPSLEAAKAMYNDPDYVQNIKPIRIKSTSNCTIVLVKEFETPSDF